MDVSGAQTPKVRRTRVGIEHVCIVSNKSYAELRGVLRKLPRFDERIRTLLREGEIELARAALGRTQGDAGLTIFSVATHGHWLQIISEERAAIQYAMGNILTAMQMLGHGLMTALYAPLRVILYENDAGTGTFEYDRPSTLFGQFGNEEIARVARQLDQAIHHVLLGAAM